MNTSVTAYTHLESLLLFQSLNVYGVASNVWPKISDLLKANPYVTQNKDFQSGRLSPESLRTLYLHELKAELRAEHDQQDGEVPSAEVKGARKRKAPSPKLQTLEESLRHQHLIPKLVNKLYARYRAAITNQIRQDEERYERLQRELHAIERGEWDNQLRERASRKHPSRSPSLPGKSPSLAHQPLPSHSAANSPLPDTIHAKGPTTLAPLPGGTFYPNIAPAKTPLPQNGQVPPKPSPSASPRKKQISADNRGKQVAPQAQSAPSPSPHPPQTPPSLGPHPPPHTQPPANTNYTGPPLSNQPPHLQPHPATPGPQSAPPSGSQHAPYRSYAPHLQPGNVPGPQFQPHMQPYGLVPQLAPVPGAQPPQHSPTHQRYAASHQTNPQSPSVHTPQPQLGYTPVAGQPPYLTKQSQLGQPPPKGGFMLPPFQVAPQDPSRSHQQITHLAQQPQVSTPVNVRHPSINTTPHTVRQGAPQMHPLNVQTSNTSTPVDIRTILSALSTPRTPKTAWKSSVRNLRATPISRPDISPIDDFLPDGQQQQDAPKSRSTRKSRAKAKAKQKEAEADHAESDRQTEETIPEMETRQGRPRRKAPVKRGRPGSIASSHAGTSVRERSRSHSILSHTETIAADGESQAGSRIKSEDTVDEGAATPSHMPNRGRGATKSNNKRKRIVREITPEDSEDRPGTPGLPRTVVAPRHFSRMCTPLMNDIGSHRHASTFTTAVKAKDAEGYYDIIKRPTDLKTIQKAIAAGAKQVAAAASSDTPSGSPGGAGGVVELPYTVENIPPKAIVNSSQLEKELMRMFVNAVMFNSGEEGVVEDAREMFESVQRSVSSWRSVEPSGGRTEVEETPPVTEDDVPVASKRRKL